MSRVLAAAVCLTIALTICACSGNKQPPAAETSNQSTPRVINRPSQPIDPQTQPPAQPGELQPGHASGSYTVKGEVVALKYAYAGRGERFGSPSLIVLVTDKPIPPEAVAEEIRSTTLLDGEKIRGLEYVLDESSMWVKYHPSQYQESSSNKLKDYKVENEIVRGFDDNDGNLSNGKYARSVKFRAAIVK